MLFKLSKNSLPLYREAYRKDWPKYHLTYTLLDHYIDRIKKFPEWDNKVHFYTIDKVEEKIPEDASFVFYDGNYIHFETLSQDFQKLKDILQQLDFNGDRNFVCMRLTFKSLIHEIIDQKKLEKVYEVNGQSYIIDDNVELAETLINACLIDDFYLDNLKEKDAAYIYEQKELEFLYPYESIKNCIKYNPTTGIYRKSDDRLIGWLLYCEFGAVGHFYVDKMYQGQHIGTCVGAAHLIKLSRQGKIINGTATAGSATSKIIQKNPYTQSIDKRFAIGARKSCIKYKLKPKL